jgi:hypothetical protein
MNRIEPCVLHDAAEDSISINGAVMWIIGDTSDIERYVVRSVDSLVGWNVDWKAATLTMVFTAGETIALRFDTTPDVWRYGQSLLEAESVLYKAVADGTIADFNEQEK